jgi:Ca-activated chloride channel family protein
MLIFVIDVSGSMDMENRLGLVKQSLAMLTRSLRPTDRIGIVVYGSDARIVLSPTEVGEADQILRAIDSLRPEGSTNAEAGLRVAYDMASEFQRPGEISRLILASDGVANVGNVMADQILQHAEEGIALSTFGFGMGNYNDILMEQLADKGNGAYAYIDTIDEAERVFSQHLTSAIMTIAKDAKIQVTFNENVLDRYRLLGYENRDVADEDFRNDEVDAGEIGAGHSVTALYEVRVAENAPADEVAMTVAVRYADPETDEVQEISQSIRLSDFAQRFEDASPRFQLDALVAEFAEILRNSFWAQDNSLEALVTDARRIAEYLVDDSSVREFVQLVELAAAAPE